jgi:hypothetical protein
VKRGGFTHSLRGGHLLLHLPLEILDTLLQRVVAVVELLKSTVTQQVQAAQEVFWRGIRQDLAAL